MSRKMRSVLFAFAVACNARDSAADPAASLVVTSGAVSSIGPGLFRVNVPGMRADAPRITPRAATLSYVYRGPTHDTVPLASGELRRQIGLKLKSKDSCNVVYVMWHIAPAQGIYVSVKSNPGQTTHEDCGANGYIDIAPTRRGATPAVTPGIRNVMHAAIAGDVLTVTTNGAFAWEAKLPPAAFAFDGPAGVRSDNGVFDFSVE